MKKLSLNTLLLVVIAFALAMVANGQATRTWVSGVGDDVNPCSRTAPCKTFAGAISKTATDGEINCLDPGGFGAVTITKSITIDCTGTLGSILSSGTNGIIINITSGTDTRKSVRLRGLAINGASTGTNGIRILAGNAVSIEHTVIDGVTTHGISIETTSGTPKISVNNTTIRGAVGNGINSFITGGTVNLEVSETQILKTATGINLSNNTKAAVKNTVLSQNTTGILAANAEAVVSDCVMTGNSTGVSALSGGNITLNGSTISHNNTGLSISGGIIATFSNNALIGNTTNGGANSFLTLQ